MDELLEELKYTFDLTGNRYTQYLFNNYESIEDLTFQLRKYNSELLVEDVDIEEESDDDENPNKNLFQYFYLSGRLIDSKNIGGVDLSSDYDQKRSKMIYSIIFYKKFVNDDDTSFELNYTTEEERDKYFDILIYKLKRCGINII